MAPRPCSQKVYIRCKQMMNNDAKTGAPLEPVVVAAKQVLIVLSCLLFPLAVLCLDLAASTVKYAFLKGALFDPRVALLVFGSLMLACVGLGIGGAVTSKRKVILAYYIFMNGIIVALLDISGVLLFFSFLGPQYTAQYLSSTVDVSDPKEIAQVTSALKVSGGLCLGFLLLASLALWAAAVVAGLHYILRRTCQVLNCLASVFGVVMIGIAISKRNEAPWAASLVGSFGAITITLGVLGFFAIGERKRNLIIVFLTGMSLVSLTVFILAVLCFSMPQKTADFLNKNWGTVAPEFVGCDPNKATATTADDCTTGAVVGWWEARPALIGGIVSTFLVILGTNMVAAGHQLTLSEKGELKPMRFFEDSDDETVETPAVPLVARHTRIKYESSASPDDAVSSVTMPGGKFGPPDPSV